jgi:hypothetical protein
MAHHHHAESRISNKIYTLQRVLHIMGFECQNNCKQPQRFRRLSITVERLCNQSDGPGHVKLKVQTLSHQQPTTRSAASRIRTVRYLEVSSRVWRAKGKPTMSYLPSGISNTALHNQPFNSMQKGNIDAISTTV